MDGKRIPDLQTAGTLNLGDYLVVENNGVTRKTTVQALQGATFGDIPAGVYRHCTIQVNSNGVIQSISNGALTATTTLDFPSIGAAGSETLPVAVTGASVGDPVVISLPAAFNAGLVATAWVSSTNVVSIRISNITASGIDPASASFKVVVLKT